MIIAIIKKICTINVIPFLVHRYQILKLQALVICVYLIKQYHITFYLYKLVQHKLSREDIPRREVYVSLLV